MNNTFMIMTGSLPPDVCGVGDYTYSLMMSLKDQGLTVQPFHETQWHLRSLFTYVGKIHRSGAPVLNIQYPTQGYGWSIVPQLVCSLMKPTKTIVTLHEFSNRTVKAQAATYLFFLTADWLIFTTDYERSLACKVAPWIRSRSSVIELASNIPFCAEGMRDVDIVYFGQIRPGKGLEDYTATISSPSIKGLYRVQVIGRVSEGYEEYAASITETLETLGVEVILDKSPEDVSVLLSRAKLALLPFPDGVSLRRGSALASMGNGALLVTRTPTQRDAQLDDVCVAVLNVTDLAATVVNVLDNYEDFASIREAGRKLAQSFSWTDIADQYIEVISALSSAVS